MAEEVRLYSSPTKMLLSAPALLLIPREIKASTASGWPGLRCPMPLDFGDADALKGMETQQPYDFRGFGSCLSLGSSTGGSSSWLCPCSPMEDAWIQAGFPLDAAPSPAWHSPAAFPTG